MFDSGAGGGPYWPGTAVPSAALVDSLVTTPPATVDDSALIDQLVDYERCISWLRAKQVRVIEESAHRNPVRPGLLPGGKGRIDNGGPAGASEYLVSDISAALAISSAAATDRIEIAADLVRRLPAALAASEAGDIDCPRAAAISDETSSLTDEVAGAVEAAVVPSGPVPRGQHGAGQHAAAVPPAPPAQDPHQLEGGKARRDQRAVDQPDRTLLR